MVMLPSTMRYNPKTNRSFIYTMKNRLQSGLNGELLFLDVPNDHLHFLMVSEYLPNNMFSYKLKQANQNQERVFLVEFGEEGLASAEGRVMNLHGIYRFVVRDVSPLRDKALYKILRDKFLEQDQPPWYPENLSILVMVPFLDEDSETEDIWLSVGSPLDPLISSAIEDVDAWILKAVARETNSGGNGSTLKEVGATMSTTAAMKGQNESLPVQEDDSGIDPKDIAF